MAADNSIVIAPIAACGVVGGAIITTGGHLFGGENYEVTKP